MDGCRGTRICEGNELAMGEANERGLWDMEI